jgi:hypothetical protein
MSLEVTTTTERARSTCRGLERLGQADVGHQHRDAEAAHRRQVAVALVQLGGDQGHAQLVEQLDHAVADVAEPADDHVVVEPAGDVGAEDAGQPGADQGVGDQGEQDGQGGRARQHQGHAVQLQQGWRVAQVDVAEAGGGHDRDREVDGVDQVEVLLGEPPEDGDAGDGEAEDDGRHHPQADVGPEQDHPGGGQPAAVLHRRPLRMPHPAGWRRSLDQAQHRLVGLREQLGRAVEADPGQGEQHPGVGGGGPPHDQGLAGDLDPLLPVLEQCRRHQCGHGQGGRVEHLAVLEQRLDPAAQLAVEHPQPHPQRRVQLLGGQGGVEVADVVVLGDDQRARHRHPGGPQHRLVAVVTGDQGGPQLPGPLGQLLGLGADHHDHVHAQVDQLLQGAVAELVQAAEDDVPAGRRCRLFHVPYLLPAAGIGTCRRSSRRCAGCPPAKGWMGV